MIILLNKKLKRYRKTYTKINTHINNTLHIIATLMALIVSSHSIAQSNTTVEAETAELLGTAAVYSDGQASGGQGVAFLNTLGAGFTLNNVPAADTITVRYASMNTGSMSLRVNGIDAGNLDFSSNNNWVGNYITASTAITLIAGDQLTFINDAGDQAFNVDSVEFIASASTPTPTPTLTPSEFLSQDIGNTGAQGFANLAGGTLTVNGSGHDIWHTEDAFHYYYKSFSGDGQITARIHSVTDTNIWAKAGVMIRDSLENNASNAFMLIRPSEGAAFQFRPTTGEPTHAANKPHRQPARYLRVSRVGNVYTAYSSYDGLCWDKEGSGEVSMTGNDFIGIAMTASNFGTLGSTTVTDLEVTSNIEPHNLNCDRAQVDGPIPPPSQWVVQPGLLTDNVMWEYTTTNPVSNPQQQDCWAGRRIGDDDPQCPNTSVSPFWATQSGGWNTGAVGIGNNSGGQGVIRTQVNANNIWLRKQIPALTQAQKDNVMFWGRWNDGVSIYINGVLAASNSRSVPTYRYMGMSEAARNALSTTGNNTIAVRLKNGWLGHDGGPDIYFDIGLGENRNLAQLPVTASGVEFSQTITDAYEPVIQNFMREQGISGGVFAAMKNDQVVYAKGFGYKDKALTMSMPHDALMRLASLDKIVTQAAVKKLISDGQLQDVGEYVFPLLSDLIPGESAGNNINSVTVNHLLRHIAGINHPANFIGEGQDRANLLYYTFDTNPESYSILNNLAWVYRHNTAFIPGGEKFEAESAALMGEATAGNDSAASNGQMVEFIQSNGSGLRFSNVSSFNAVTIRYASQRSGKLSLRVNGVERGKFEFETNNRWRGDYTETTLTLNDTPDQATVEVVFLNGDTAANIDYVSFVKGAYSSDGYYILRHLVEHLSGRDMDDYLDNVLLDGITNDMYVAHERLNNRDAREPGYVNDDASYDRWINLEHYLGLGGSAESYVRFLRHYDLADGSYLFENGNHINPSGGAFAGSMNGSWSITSQYSSEEFSWVIIFNNGGYFDEIFRRIEDVNQQLLQPGGALDF